jgi:uncharacterized protein (TIGR03437 family)
MNSHIRVGLFLLLTFTARAQVPNSILSVGYTPPVDYVQVTPGQLLTLFVRQLNVPDAATSLVPLPTTLSGLSVAVKPSGIVNVDNYPAFLPILRVYTETSCRYVNPPTCPNTQITVQIPTEQALVQAINRVYHDFPPELILSVRVNGITGEDLHLALYQAGNSSLHLLRACDTIFGKPGLCSPLVTHGDGTAVDGSNPAKVGETIVVYAVGGPVYDDTYIPTGYPARQNTGLDPASGRLVFSYGFDLSSGYRSYLAVEQPIGTTYFGQVAGYVGLYQINLVVPDLPAGAHRCLGGSDTNARLQSHNIDPTYLAICVQP